MADLLYALKQVAAMEKKEPSYPDRFPVYLLSRNFVRLVYRYGRNHELLLLMLFYLRRAPLALLRMAPLGCGHVSQGAHRVAAQTDPGRSGHPAEMIDSARALELPRERAPLEHVPGSIGYRAVGRLPEKAV